MHAFDVCLIPFVINKLTENIYPLKLHEYLAAGKPVVSTALPEVKQFEDVVGIGRTPEEFEYQIIKALGSKDQEDLVNAQKGVARKASWTNRARDVLAVLDNALASKKS